MKLFTLQKTSASIALVASLGITSAQVYTPKQPDNNNSQPSSQDNNSTTIVNKKEESDSPYGNEIPFIDPTQETISIMGHTFSLGDNRLGGQFESYLADISNTSDASLEYRATIDSILSTLSPHNNSLSIKQKMKEAFALLPRASSYPGDGKICDSLSNAIYTVIISQGAIKEYDSYVQSLEQEKLRIIKNSDHDLKKDKKK